VLVGLLFRAVHPGPAGDAGEEDPGGTTTCLVCAQILNVRFPSSKAAAHSRRHLSASRHQLTPLPILGCVPGCQKDRRSKNFRSTRVKTVRDGRVRPGVGGRSERPPSHVHHRLAPSGERSTHVRHAVTVGAGPASAVVDGGNLTHGGAYSARYIVGTRTPKDRP